LQIITWVKTLAIIFKYLDVLLLLLIVDDDEDEDDDDDDDDNRTEQGKWRKREFSLFQLKMKSTFWFFFVLLFNWIVNITITTTIATRSQLYFIKRLLEIFLFSYFRIVCENDFSFLPSHSKIFENEISKFNQINKNKRNRGEGV